MRFSQVEISCLIVAGEGEKRFVTVQKDPWRMYQSYSSKKTHKPNFDIREDLLVDENTPTS